jgi:hypothetical protein
MYKIDFDTAAGRNNESHLPSVSIYFIFIQLEKRFWYITVLDNNLLTVNVCTRCKLLYC